MLGPQLGPKWVRTAIARVDLACVRGRQLDILSDNPCSLCLELNPLHVLPSPVIICEQSTAAAALGCHAQTCRRRRWGCNYSKPICYGFPGKSITKSSLNIFLILSI